MLAVTHLHQIDDVISETYAEDDHVKAFVIGRLGREAHTLFRSALHNPMDMLASSSRLRLSGAPRIRRLVPGRCWMFSMNSLAQALLALPKRRVPRNSMS